MDALDYLSEGTRMRAALDASLAQRIEVRRSRIDELRQLAIAGATPEDVALRARLLAGVTSLEAEVDLRWGRDA